MLIGMIQKKSRQKNLKEEKGKTSEENGLWNKVSFLAEGFTF